MFNSSVYPWISCNCQRWSGCKNMQFFLWKLTLTLASVKLVHIAISSLVLMSGYLFRAKVASSSCNCWLVKCVRCLRWRFVFLSFLPSSVSVWSTPASVLIESCNDRLAGKKHWNFNKGGSVALQSKIN